MSSVRNCAEWQCWNTESLQWEGDIRDGHKHHRKRWHRVGSTVPQRFSSARILPGLSQNTPWTLSFSSTGQEMELWESFLCLVPSPFFLIGVVLLVVCQNLLSLGQGCEWGGQAHNGVKTNIQSQDTHARVQKAHCQNKTRNTHFSCYEGVWIGDLSGARVEKPLSMCQL